MKSDRLNVMARGKGGGLQEITPDVRATPQSASSTRSLTRNTLIMSVRTLLTLSVSLYSSRIILDELGTVDYGIYFAVAGVTLVISFLNSALAGSTQRFLNIELAKGNTERVRATFSASMQIHGVIALLTLLALETIGLWLFNTHMVIPESRMAAARVAFHYAAFTVAMTFVQVPYSAALVASERFGLYAVFDIAHAFLRLLVAVLLIVGSGGDELVFFSALMFGVTLVITVAKAMFCMTAFPFSRYRVCLDRTLHSGMAAFAGWNILGAASLVLSVQGVGILLNLFYGPIANAAQNIAVQLTNVASTLGSNLQITASPQIIKAYATGDDRRFHELLEQSVRFCFLIMLVPIAPVVIGTDVVFGVWLTSIPDHAVDIARVLLLTSLVNSFSFPLMAAAQATGNIRTYQVVLAAITLCALPLGYFLLAHGAGLLSIFQLMLVLSVVGLGVRLVLLSRMVGLNLPRFLHRILLPSGLIAAVCLGFGWGMRSVCPENLTGGLISLLLTGLVTVLMVYAVGLSAIERSQIQQAISRRILGSRA